LKELAFLTKSKREVIVIGKQSRNKGKRGERGVVQLLKQAGFEARRTAPLQADQDAVDADVLLDERFRVEVKRRKDGFRQLYGWLQDADFLFIRADRKDYIVAMSL